ncbi:ProQ/FINO family protein [Crenobacter sp. SG2303]|uniref:ProQ/FINO family protein n=1 Tax=Crenobacter oryzisoli TaxID=3056844 RepID=A0ABT7XLS2_9NEIS|nr:ProQ/FINO family protein [Crenobacter sp. SG2303]MDN0074648.1 ProQ/FINO family protein [Crenobacter sp. SG2303]
MSKETALGAALKAAVQTMSKKKQTDMIADHVYGKYDVFRRFRPLAIGIDQALVAELPQFDPALIARVLANHCRRPRYIKALAQGGKRFGLDGKPVGQVTAEEQEVARQNPALQPQAKPAATDVPAADATPANDAE